MSKELDWATRFDEIVPDLMTINSSGILVEAPLPDLVKDRIKDFIIETITAKEDALRKDIEGMKSTENLQQMSRAGSDVRARNKILDEVLSLLTPKN